MQICPSTGKKKRYDKGREIKGREEHLNIERDSHFGVRKETVKCKRRKKEKKEGKEKRREVGMKYERNRDARKVVLKQEKEK